MALGAIGDNLGRPAEVMDYQEVEAKLGRLEDPWAGVEGGDTAFELGTDDTALGQILSHCYIERGGPISVEDYGRSWLREMEPASFFYCLRNTYELLKMGYSARVTGGLNIVTGSGLMAISPVGIFNLGDPERAYVDGLNMASLVQRDLDMFIPGVFAAAVAEAMRPGSTCDRVIETAIRIAPSQSIVTFDKRDPDNLQDTLIQAVEIASRYPDVFSAREGLYEHCLQYKFVDPQEVFALAFGIFKASRGDSHAAVVGAANTGRDADTIASLNGQLCGALNGVESISHEWLEGLQRSRSYPGLIDTAVRMTTLVIKRIREERLRVSDINSLFSKEVSKD